MAALLAGDPLFHILGISIASFMVGGSTGLSHKSDTIVVKPLQNVSSTNET